MVETLTYSNSQQTVLATAEFTKIETFDSFTSTHDLKDYFSDTKDIALLNVNKTTDNLIGYGLQNPIPFVSDTIPFITEHFQETSRFHPNTSYVGDSENISCSDESVAAKKIIDALTTLILSNLK
ncbi:hypothetical protein CDAR_271871 [Caerostris darwini]|uniref:Uncharacterized protein n=1 Tax=Caerostris darwini TaxID=1538125 RepID=A0AAV4W7F8_9ARAC|nr:hypothetical protein CDAR_271871 [Caerostris darwini]